MVLIIVQCIMLKCICENVLENTSLAPLYLSTQSGFFFGSTDYDSFYFSKLKYTVEKIDELLKNEDYDYYKYQSSW